MAADGWIMCTKLKSGFLHQISIKQSTGCDGTGDSHHAHANLQQLQPYHVNAKVSEDCFQHLLEFITQRIKLLLQAAQY